MRRLPAAESKGAGAAPVEPSCMSDFSRRDFLRTAGTAAGFGLLGSRAMSLSLDRDADFELQSGDLPRPKAIEYLKPSKPVRAIVCGFGNRGSYYASMSSELKDEWEIVGVAEPVDYKRNRAVERYNIPSRSTFVTWEHIFERPKFADVVIISTPDNLHYGPAMAALEKGYDLLLEKPIAQSWKQCEDILRLATKKGAIVGVCHVLRYAPIFVQIHEVIRSGMIGDVVSVQHIEPIYYLHFAHSYVRGPWHETKKSNPSLLAKSCHDLDILRWYVGAPCERVTSFGSLKFFRKEYAPEGAPDFCLRGCPVEDSCIYHAGNVYVHKKLWGTSHIITEDRSDAGILKALETQDYGRCVFRNDNDVVDHQIVAMRFQGDVTATFSMEAMTSYAGRRTRVMGTKGDIVADEQFIDVYDFQSQKGIRWDVNQHASDLGGHGGGDTRLVRDLIQAVSRRDPGLLTSNLTASMESHLIGFRAEESRHKGGQVMTTRMPKLT